VSDHGAVRRIKDASFPSGSVALEGHGEHFVEHKQANGEEVGSITHNGKKYELEKPSGLLTTSSFYDFSITKNVFTMLLAALLLFLIFRYVAGRYKSHPNQAPTGIQNVMEVLVMFIVNEVAKPMLGDRYLKFLPYLLTIFFFILTCNVLGLIPVFPGGANVTGNIATTAALALIAFIVVNVNGKADYWKHIFWMPGVPVLMKIFLAPIELIGVFTKPFSLMIRLFANITAGHIIILALVGLIFVFGQAGQSLGGSIGGAAISVPFTLFLSIIELLVAFLQAFIFTILTASYIGAATEEHHH
jgi:F-type H+-transporting ATPase subunit a